MILDRSKILFEVELGKTSVTIVLENRINCTQWRKKLNRLMNEIYETVTAACNMADKPGSFPTDTDPGTSEDSVKLTRSLTEKRKNYVRRVSSRVAYIDTKNIRQTRFRHQTSVCSYKSDPIDNPYSTFRSWKSFRTSQGNLMKMEDKERDRIDSVDDNLSIDDKTGCVGIDCERDRALFSVCLLVGLNYMTGKAYVKSVYPTEVQVPPHIENLIFPETLSSASKGEWAADAAGAQCYSLVLTDERGERSYGYCRRVLPEGATTCLPLCYCLIGKYRAPGFYYKVLQEIESHHGSSDDEITNILQQLYETDFPYPGEDITLTYTNKKHTKYDEHTSKTLKNTNNSIDSDAKCKTMPDLRKSYRESADFENACKNDKSVCKNDKSVCKNDKSVCKNDKSACESDDSVSSRTDVNFDFSKSENERSPDYYDFDNNNFLRSMLLSLEGTRIKTLKRPIEPRVDEHNLSALLDCLGAGLVIKVFSSLLLERKVLIISDQLTLVSSCMEALQSSLYPFVWQQPLISTIPAEIQRDVLEAPLPILAGMLRTADIDTTDVAFEEGMLIDLTQPQKVLFYQGDESTILPTAAYKTLKTSLQMESSRHKPPRADAARNLMIAEAFLRFFVDILGDFWRYFSFGELKEGALGKGDVVFDKENFIKNAATKQNQFFLEWFTETAMFNHFIQNMAVIHKNKDQNNQKHQNSLVDTPLPDFYDIFHERVKSRSKNIVQKPVDNKNNYKNALNKRVKLLKTKLRELVN